MSEWKIEIERCPEDRRQPIPTDGSKLGFGRLFTDHYFRCRFDREHGWHDAKIVPRTALDLDPAAMVLHYGLEVFEGLKAYRAEGDSVHLFRWRKNAERLQRSAARLEMEAPPVELFGAGVRALVELEKDWVPKAEGCSLYIRPTLVASDPFLGVRPADEFLFYVLCSPVGAYYATGFQPTRILVEEHDVRAVEGGTGEAKTGGNYAASLRAQRKAKEAGYTQVLWLDAKEHRYVEEVGTSNIFFEIDGKVITPPLGGTILPGVTRDSVLQLLKHWDVPVSEERITIDEVLKASEEGRLGEAFGTGTAAVISPVGVLGYRGRDIRIHDEKVGPLSQRLYDALTGIQYQREPDPFEWTEKVC
ncbi:MAG TPA: branched-chain amino acid aminotransferase [Polyangiaceae bacterium LLY-WYZ-15_(1-7)]|nr:branched chain amino acid aminotransferase [Myxococcales bacterium]MAT25561.1 branched chain amino acid aminotransferase [Sandaracinus sp.]HJK94626.1 branched-chain amino acid aminotransferase [Polyangiaceae bacterium LLY-WYZ-15_(1-7)]MBJ74941.1 branched chain amino acid aminotransferase [Sandaracinus sp.]HJL05038.1 branched-chain amino acid aminotransferase [Polyangiaceae bacterium LLY-WYZ-15_(1-7)]